MYSAADLLEALQRRLRLTVYRTRPGEFPPGWQAWFSAMREHPGRVTGAPAEDFLRVWLQRPLANPPRRSLPLNRWQAFSRLWRQQWQPPGREDRGLRWFAACVSGGVHVLFALGLLWLMLLSLLPPPPAGEESVVQVEFIGVGTPEEVGGGPMPDQQVTEARPSPNPPAARAPSAQPPASAASPPELPRPPAIATRPAAPALQAPIPQVAPRAVPEPAPAEQPLAVSAPAVDQGRFVLPPATRPLPETALATPELAAPSLEVQQIDVPAPLPTVPATVPEPQLRRPVLSVEVPEVATRDVPTPLPSIETSVPQPQIRRPALSATVPDVTVREVPAPLPQPQVAPLPAPELATRPLQPRVAEVRPVELPTPAPARTAPAAATPNPAATAAPAPTAAASPRPSPAREPGAGPKPEPAPGGWPDPARADDWDLAERDRPGAASGEPPGLYDSAGRVRLPGEGDGGGNPDSGGGGLPPGTVTEEIADLDRAGTWLKRPPVDYEPTAFDQYWRPNETLLEEWVRRSITTIRIPIPGTSKTIVCQTVLLVVGGGCGVSDPNLNEQPAVARPPPDIPFKPELQEDNGSVRPAGG